MIFFMYYAKKIIVVIRYTMNIKKIIKNNYLDEEFICEYKNYEIFIIKDDNNEPWFNSKPICKALGYVRHIHVIKAHIIKNNRKQFEELNKYIIKKKYIYYVHPSSVFINKEGLLQLFISCKLPSIDKISKFFGIETIYRYKRKEIEILDELKIFFGELGIKYKTQKYVNKYRVDIYIAAYNLVIEIDENDHINRDKKYEKKREENIKKWIHCNFIRCNPDKVDFNIHKLTAKITKYMLKYQSENQI